MVQYGFYFDQSRCIGCNACLVACKQWHQLPPGPQKWIRVYQWERGSFPNTRLHFLAIPCYHCEKPLCVKACPNGAVYKEEKYGAVLVDPDKCTGERRCWRGCPYGSMMFAGDEIGEKASKCNMCIDRLREGKQPICVLSCSMRALEFGRITELRKRFGHLQQLEEMPSADLTLPSIVFNPSQPKRQIVTWNAEKALQLWRNRGPYLPETSRPLFDNVQDVTEIPSGMVGKNRLVLKAKNRDALMYYTTDDD
jgi:anaerobic dimethyl sulfoxide reductase subunit B (iron-sulfur subunit)